MRHAQPPVQRVGPSLRLWLTERVATWARRRQGEEVTPLVLQARRLYILPTRAGLGFALLLLVMLIAGLNYSNSLALLLTFMLTGFVLVGMYECQRTLQGLALTQVRVLDCCAGDLGWIELHLSNPGPVVRRALSAGAPGAAPALFEIAAGGTAIVRMNYPALRRGRVQIDRLELATTTPFGLFRAWTWVYLPLIATVYPRPAGRRPLPINGSRPPPRASALPGADEEQWSSLRPYQPGDSPRRIAWKIYARGGPPMVGLYEGTGGGEHWLSFVGLEALDLEVRLSQLCAWALECARRGAACSLRLPGCELPLGRSSGHRTALLRALAGYGEAPVGAEPSA